MPPLSSSHLAAADWHAGTMTIQFHDGSVYAYQNVPAPTYQSLLAAKSKGKFFRSAIQAKFKYAVLKKPRPQPPKTTPPAKKTPPPQ